VRSLGCKVNQYDAENICAQLGHAGFILIDEKTDPEHVPDVCIVFTCSVTAESDRKSRQIIRHLIKQYPDALIVAASCYAEIRPEDLREIPGVDLVIGTSNLDTLASEVCTALRIPAPDLRFHGVEHFRKRTRAFIKIQDGCNQFCAYCQIPLTRGAPQSRSHEEVIEEVRVLVESGHSEVVLCGIRLGAYGLDREEPNALPELLQALDEVPGLQRYRLSSIEPNDLSETMLATLPRLKRFAPHLHVPLQSGSTTVLRRMNRRYTVADYEALVDKLRASIPNLAVSTDVLVGFPGETEEEALETFETVKRLGFSKVHLFPFSPRPGTAASDLPERVEPKVIQHRRRMLDKMARECARAFKLGFIGRRLEVLMESTRFKNRTDGVSCQTGFSENYLRVGIPSVEKQALQTGRIYGSIITRLEGDLLLGRIEKDDASRSQQEGYHD